jgi:R3H domain
VTVHKDVAAVVDAMLLGRPVGAQIRVRGDDGTVSVREQSAIREFGSNGQAGGRVSGMAPVIVGLSAAATLGGGTLGGVSNVDQSGALQPVRVLPFGVSRPKLEQAARELQVPISLALDVSGADLVLTLKPYYRRKPQLLRDAEASGTPIWVLKNNTGSQMQTALAGMFNLEAPSPPPAETADAQSSALQEAEDAINLVMEGGPALDLAPQNPYIRRMQHRLAERYNLGSRSHGKEPNRRVRILATGVQPS